jgi:predicted peroxiredoxin
MDSMSTAKPGYLLIESRDPLAWHDAWYFYDLAAALARAENKVTLFLVQNGVLAARDGSHVASFEGLVRAGVEVLADSFSLRERGLPESRLAEGVTAASLDAVVERLAAGQKTLWH